MLIPKWTCTLACRSWDRIIALVLLVEGIWSRHLLHICSIIITTKTLSILTLEYVRAKSASIAISLLLVKLGPVTPWLLFRSVHEVSQRFSQVVQHTAFQVSDLCAIETYEEFQSWQTRPLLTFDMLWLIFIFRVARWTLPFQ